MKPQAGLSKGQRVSKTANRLRMIQMGGAELPDADRTRMLDEEVGVALKELAPDERRAFLQGLMEEFPEWGVTVNVIENQAPAPITSTFDTEQLKNSTFLVDQLIQSLPSDDAKRQEIATKLSRAGLRVPGEPRWPQKSAEELRKSTGMQPTDPINPERALDMLAMLSAFSFDLDQVGWATWRELSRELPDSTVRRPVDLKVTFRKCVAGDANTPKAVITPGVQQLRVLLSSFINTVPLIAQFAASQAGKLSPAFIKKSVDMQGGGMFGKEKRYWEKYVELSGTFNEAEFERAIKKFVAEKIGPYLNA